MVENCKILTEAVSKIKSINNFKFNKILFKIKNITKSRFAKIEYIYMYWKFNKKLDVIVIATNHFKENEMEVVFDRNWNLRFKQLTTISEEWIIENFKL